MATLKIKRQDGWRWSSMHFIACSSLEVLGFTLQNYRSATPQGPQEFSDANHDISMPTMKSISSPQTFIIPFGLTQHFFSSWRLLTIVAAWARTSTPLRVWAMVYHHGSAWTSKQYESTDVYGSLRGDPDVWNEGVLHKGMDLGYGSWPDQRYGSPVGLGYGSGPYIYTDRHDVCHNCE